jgi:hypothetical protein
MRGMIQCMKCRLSVHEDCAKVTSKTKQYQCFDCKLNKQSNISQATQQTCICICNEAMHFVFSYYASHCVF